jgi:DNA invertase Pin-like site-specific DNA recombinase
MAGVNVGYIRVSSEDQETARQLDGVLVEKTFVDKVSGKNTDRAQLQAMLEYIREGDTVHIHSMDRLARNLIDLRTLVTRMTGKGVVVKFMKEHLSFTGTDDPMSTLLMNVIGAVAEFERSIIRERQREGIAIAKRKGVYKGSMLKLSQDNIEEMKRLVSTGVPVAKVCKQYKINRRTYYRYLKKDTKNSEQPAPPDTDLQEQS